ncbi:MAG: ribosomal RNA small subunit methyltransferase A [Collinsella aerofaciens]
MALAELTGSERVLEVGPGIGTLTLTLVQEAARVTSIEMDTELEPVLSAHAMDHSNFRFIMGDALAVPPAAIAEALDGEPELLVANLPYNVAATIILQFFQTMPSLRRAVVMVQKEVADRFVACRDQGLAALYAKLAVRRGHGALRGSSTLLMPAPHVDSCCENRPCGCF